MNLKDSNLQNIKLRPLSINDFEYVLKWSKDDTFCSANGWEKNRNEQELYRWWQHFVNNLSEDFIRLGIEFENRLIGYADLACIKGNEAELGIAIGDSSLWGKGIGFNASMCMPDQSVRCNYTIFHIIR